MDFTERRGRAKEIVASGGVECRGKSSFITAVSESV